MRRRFYLKEFPEIFADEPSLLHSEKDTQELATEYADYMIKTQGGWFPEQRKKYKSQGEEE